MLVNPQLLLSVLYFNKTSAFFRSVAYARAVEQKTKIVWRDHSKDNLFFNIAYTLMPWKGRLGLAEVRQDRNGILLDTDKYHREYLDAYSRKLAQSPASAVAYASYMAALRKNCLASVQETFRDAVRLNRDIGRSVGESIRALNDVQFAATIAVNIAAVAGGPGFSVLSTLYSMGVKVAQNPAQVSGSKLIFVAKETGKGMGPSAAQQVGKGLDTIVAEGDAVTDYAFRKLEEAGKPVNDRLLASLRGIENTHLAAGAIKGAGYALSAVFFLDAAFDEWKRHKEISTASRM